MTPLSPRQSLPAPSFMPEPNGTPMPFAAEASGAPERAGLRPMVAGALYLIDDPVRRSACWERLWHAQKLALPDARAALLVALAEAIGSLATAAERTRAVAQVLLDLPCLAQPQQVELVAALAERIGAQPAAVFRKATFDDLNAVVTQFDGHYRHAAHAQLLASLDGIDALTLDHVFGEILRGSDGFATATGAALLMRLAGVIRRLPAPQRLARFASLNSLLRHASTAPQAELDIALLEAIACIDDPLERSSAFSSAMSTLARLPEQQRRVAGPAVIRAFGTLAPHLKPAAFNELLMLAALGSAPRMVERLLQLIPLASALAFHQIATAFSWMEALTAACPQREQARIYAGFVGFTNSILQQRPRQTLRSWIACRLSRLDAEGQAFFADAILDESMAALARLRAGMEQNQWQQEQLHAFNALVDLMPLLSRPVRPGFANAICNLIRAAKRAGRPYSRALWDSFAPHLTPESQTLMCRRLGFSVDVSASP